MIASRPACRQSRSFAIQTTKAEPSPNGVISEKTNGKAVNFTHYASGKVKTATPEGGPALTMVYDLQGNRTHLNDPDAGLITSQYDGWGQLNWEKQRVHNHSNEIITGYQYHSSGLLQSKNRNNEITAYEYDPLHRLRQVSISGHTQSYGYDAWDRIIQTADVVEGSKSFVRQTEYDGLGRISKETYPSGYFISNLYDSYGYLTKVNDPEGNTLWQAKESNARGQLTKTESAGRETEFNFDNRGFPQSTTTPGVAMEYQFDTRGNLEMRRDLVLGQQETFYYDPLNRLDTWYTNGDANRMRYAAAPGSIAISEKSDAGYDMRYGENGFPPHALTSYITFPNTFPSAHLQDIEYTDFKKVKRIEEGDNQLFISYGVDEQRIKSIQTGSRNLTRYYMGDYEEEIATNGSTMRKIHYICGGNGLAAIYIQNASGEKEMYYAHTDYQGSLIALSLANGSIVQRYAYDPWGNRRNPENWTQPDNRPAPALIILRGYTQHEHLPEFKLINMNGRVYDPVTAQFLSPDPYLQAPGDWLNYNRYSYALNNPFKYTDPTGEFAWLPLIFMALQNGLMQGIMTEMNSGNFWSGFAKGAVISTASSLLTFGVGEVLGHTAGNFGTELLRAGAHGLIGGGVNAAQGGNFWQGFGTGFASSFAGSGMSVLGMPADLLPLATGAIGAGTSWLMGGNPLNGFMQGFNIGALNHSGDGIKYYKWEYGNETVYSATLPELVVTAPYPKSFPFFFPDYNFDGNSAWWEWAIDGALYAGDFLLGGPTGESLAAKGWLTGITKGASAGGKTVQVTAKARTAEKGLEIGERFLKTGYKEIKPGVFRSADGLRQFRMTNGDILGLHGGRIGPHFNFEIYSPFNLRTPITNYHMPIY